MLPAERKEKEATWECVARELEREKAMQGRFLYSTGGKSHPLSFEISLWILQQCCCATKGKHTTTLFSAYGQLAYFLPCVYTAENEECNRLQVSTVLVQYRVYRSRAAPPARLCTAVLVHVHVDSLSKANNNG